MTTRTDNGDLTTRPTTYEVVWVEDKRLLNYQSFRGVPIVPTTHKRTGLTREEAERWAEGMWEGWSTVEVTINQEPAAS